MGAKSVLTRLFLIFVLLIVFSISAYSEDYTLSDVVTAQEEGATDIETMSSDIESTTEFNGTTQPLVYEYVMQRDEDNEVKVMVTTKGIFTLQFMVDTALGSVTYLMADGSKKEYKIPEEDLAEIQMMAGVGGVIGAKNLKNVYASKSGSAQVMTDAGYEGTLDKQKIETEDLKISVKKKNRLFGEDFAEVTYINKKAEKSGERWDKSIIKIKTANPKNDKAAKFQEKAVAKFEKHKERMMKSLVAKKIERINMKSGLVEDQELYNIYGEKLGWFKIKDTKKQRVLKRDVRNNIKEKVRNRIKGKVREIDFEEKFWEEYNNELSNTSMTDENGRVVEFPTETEGEMASSEGLSRFKTKFKEIKINGSVKFNWIDVEEPAEEYIRKKKELKEELKKKQK